MNTLPSELSSRGLRQADLARLLGVEKSMVSKWARNRVPAERLVDIERLTGIPREVLRPDIFAPTTPTLPPKPSEKSETSSAASANDTEGAK